MTGWTKIDATSLVATPWRNGMGVSRDIATVRGTDGALAWQVSIADLVQDAPFSDYPHCDRVFTPIEGAAPPELAFAGGAFEPCPLLVPKRFPGDVPTLSRIPAPGRAFNAVVDRRRHTAEVMVLRLAAGEAVELRPAAHVVVHCLSGGLETSGFLLALGDSAVGPSGGVATARGPTVAIVVSIAEVSARAN